MLVISIAIACGRHTDPSFPSSTIAETSRPKPAEPGDGFRGSAVPARTQKECIIEIPAPERDRAKCTKAESEKCESIPGITTEQARLVACGVLTILGRCKRPVPASLEKYRSTCRKGPGPFELPLDLPGKRGLEARIKRILEGEQPQSHTVCSDENIQRVLRDVSPYFWYGTSQTYYGNTHEHDEWREIDPNSDYQKAADSTLLIARAESFKSDDTGCPAAVTTTLRAYHAKKSVKLCTCEPFHDQPVFAKALTGVVVAGKYVVTTCHGISVDPNCCARNGDREGCRSDACMLSQHMLVRNFRMPVSSGPIKLTSADLIDGSKVRMVASSPPEKDDWAVLELPESLGSLPVTSIGATSVAQEVVAFGHPLGLPLKWVAGGRIRNDAANAQFLHDLDAQGGSSGSPIFRKGGETLVGRITGSGVGSDIKHLRPCGSTSSCLRSPVCQGCGPSAGADASEIAALITQLEKGIPP